MECVFPENIHNFPMDNQWNFRGGGEGRLKCQKFQRVGDVYMKYFFQRVMKDLQ